MGWSELEGIANRGDFDLTQHAEHSRREARVRRHGDRRALRAARDRARGAASGRTLLALLCDAYDEEEVGGRERMVLRLHPRLAPVKVAVLPLVNKDGQPEKARAIYEELRARMPAEYDTGGSIGKRYRRQDEIGTPWGVTVDHQTMEDDTVTLRDRDTLEQARMPVAELADELAAGSAEPQAAGSAGCARTAKPQAAGSAGCARPLSRKRPARPAARGPLQPLELRERPRLPRPAPRWPSASARRRA